jgi:hypothetical protein
VVAHTCNPSTQEAEVEGLQVWGQPGLHSETLPQKQNETKKILNFVFLKRSKYAYYRSLKMSAKRLRSKDPTSWHIRKHCLHIHDLMGAVTSLSAQQPLLCPLCLALSTYVCKCCVTLLRSVIVPSFLLWTDARGQCPTCDVHKVGGQTCPLWSQPLAPMEGSPMVCEGSPLREAMSPWFSFTKTLLQTSPSSFPHPFLGSSSGNGHMGW